MKKKELMVLISFVVFGLGIAVSVLYFLESFKRGETSLAMKGFELVFGTKNNRKFDVLKFIAFIAPAIGAFVAIISPRRIGYVISTLFFALGVILVLTMKTDAFIPNYTVKVNLNTLGILAVTMNIISGVITIGGLLVSDN